MIERNPFVLLAELLPVHQLADQLVRRGCPPRHAKELAIGAAALAAEPCEPGDQVSDEDATAIVDVVLVRELSRARPDMTERTHEETESNLRRDR